jgi:hypothetical protein
MNFFDHKDLGNHLLQLCPKVVKHPLGNVSEECVEICFRNMNNIFGAVRRPKILEMLVLIGFPL